MSYTIKCCAIATVSVVPLFIVLLIFTASDGKPGSKTAKKGRKKLVLFSTGGMRGVN